MTVVPGEAATAGLHQTVPFAAHLGIELVAAEPSAATGRLAWQESRSPQVECFATAPQGNVTQASHKYVTKQDSQSPTRPKV